MRLEKMSKLIQIYKQLLKELENEKKLASKPNEKILKEVGQNIRNHGPQKDNNL